MAAHVVSRARQRGARSPPPVPRCHAQTTTPGPIPSPMPSPMPSPKPNQVRRLLGCLGFASRLESSPYADLLSPEQWGRAATAFEAESLALLGQPRESPLHLCVEAGRPR